MKKLDLSGYNTPTKIYWIIMSCLSVASLVIAAFGLFAFSVGQYVMLAVALIIAALVNQHRFIIPKTKINVSVRKMVVFWGAIWLGIPGAILLATVSSIARYRLTLKDKNHWLLSVYVNIVAALAGAEVFYLVLNRLAEINEPLVAANLIGVEYLLPAAAIMMVVHALTASALNTIFLKLDCDYPILSLWKESYFQTIVGYLIAFVGAFLVHSALLYFGKSFGFLVLPVVIVGHIAYRIHFKKLELKTKEITEASRIHLATVEALATAIDARDQVGIGHVRRTQIIAIGLGEILGLSAGEIEALHTGALLHDIGKLAVPDHILNKPGRLTPAEMEKMKIHSSVGASILEKVNFPYPVVPTVRHHHERWDGTGYPAGLKEEEIPVTARILSVADAYDALCGARPFRKPVSRDDARKLLLKNSGTQFDPRIVDVFLRNLRKFENEIERQGLAYRLDTQGMDDLDITFDSNAADQKSLEAHNGYVAQIKRANREVFALYELARVFSSALNLHDTLSLFVKKISEMVPFETCVIYLFSKSQDYADAAYVEGENAEALKNKRIKPGEGATGFVLKKRQSVCNVNPGLDFTFHQIDSIPDYSTMASLPLIAGETLVGAVSLYSYDLEEYEDEHMRLLETVSRIASDAISKSLYHAETETKALTDPMTNLPNARSLQIHFEKEVARAVRKDGEFQLLMLDLDGFKAVNDTFGHKTGDQLLREISKVMRAQLRDYDFLARYAGDEFVAIIPETGERDISELCERLEKAVKDFKLPIGDGGVARVGVSLGSASYPKSGETLDQVIIAADKAMYSVKAEHKKAKNTAQQPKKVDEEAFIVELDESHIISSAIN